jgi:hypothetical protein
MVNIVEIMLVVILVRRLITVSKITTMSRRHPTAAAAAAAAPPPPPPSGISSRTSKIITTALTEEDGGDDGCSLGEGPGGEKVRDHLLQVLEHQPPTLDALHARSHERQSSSLDGEPDTLSRDAPVGASGAASMTSAVWGFG